MKSSYTDEKIINKQYVSKQMCFHNSLRLWLKQNTQSHKKCRKIHKRNILELLYPRIVG